MSNSYQNFIGGKWRPSKAGETMPVLNPADSLDVLGHCQKSTRQDARRAVAAAVEAFGDWRQTPPPARARIVRRVLELAAKRVDELARLMTREMGKLFSEARGEILKGNALLEWYAGEGLRFMGTSAPSELPGNFLFTVRKPLGPVALITPWNFPWAIPCWKIAPALVGGNTVVFKPAEDTPLLALKLCELFEQAGLPPGVLNVVTGLGEEVGDELVRHDDIRAISFTGSTAVGTQINEIAASRLCKVSLEMGGKNACVLLDDADLDLALGGIVSGAFGNAGQRCTATSRLILHESIADTFLEMLTERTRTLRVGPGLDEKSQVGPVVNEQQHRRILDYIEIGKEEAELVTGGGVPADEGLRNGYFIVPTIFDKVHRQARIAQEEIFGPVLSIIRVGSYEEALEVANGVIYGLSSAVYTRDINRAMRFIEDIEAGMIHINSSTLGGEAQVPFGGIKASGLGGREMAKEGIEFFTEPATVFIDYTGGVRASKIY